MRVNARLEQSAADQLQFLVQELGVSVSEVVRRGIESLHGQLAPKKRPTFKFLRAHVGKYDLGDADVSVNYKQEVAKFLDKKYPEQSNFANRTVSLSTQFSKQPKLTKPRKRSAETASA